MKVIYCIASVYNPGGMERVLLNKLRWFTGQGGYDLTIVTTDQNGRPPFYDFPKEVRMIDLGINYSADNVRSPLVKIGYYFWKRWRHRHRLSDLLKREKADIVVSLYPSESSFIPKIKDGSKKILELHYNKYFRLQYNRKGLLGLADRFRTWQDEHIVRRFDRFVVLTHEDAEYWGALPNLEVIPNAVITPPGVCRYSETRRVLAVGRLDYQKGFDRLLDAWSLLPVSLRNNWHLDIYGQGEWKEMLQKQIDSAKIKTSAQIHIPTTDIFSEYANSAFLVMSSHYEGFPMVMVEAMSYGLPVVTFDYPCGPRDIIRDGKNGILVPDGDIPALARAMERVMTDGPFRTRLGENACKVKETFSEINVMSRWLTCFQQLVS